MVLRNIILPPLCMAIIFAVCLLAAAEASRWVHERRPHAAAVQTQLKDRLYGQGQCREPLSGEILAVYKWCTDQECYTGCSIKPFDLDESMSVLQRRMWSETL